MQIIFASKVLPEFFVRMSLFFFRQKALINPELEFSNKPWGPGTE
jgi:hypothetical protein